MSVIANSPDDCWFYGRDEKNDWGKVKPKSLTIQEIFSQEWVYIWDGTQWLGSQSKELSLIPIPELLAIQ